MLVDCASQHLALTSLLQMDIGMLSRAATQLMQYVLPGSVYKMSGRLSSADPPFSAKRNLNGYVMFPSLLFVTALCRQWHACNKVHASLT